MNDVDLTALVATLDPEGRGGRFSIDDIAIAMRRLVAHINASAIPEVLHGTLHRGEHDGFWTMSKNTVLHGGTILPKSVLLPTHGQPGERLRPMNIPLRQELASWASPLRLSTAQRTLVGAVNEWLRRTDGGQVPIAAAAERAYELLRDEKAFDSYPPRGGTTLWRADRLTLEMLRCERIATPLTWEPTTNNVSRPGPIICVENHATFRTLLRVLRNQSAPEWVAVAWVQGRNTAPIESLVNMPFTVTRMDYLGDLDAPGLAIARTACANAERSALPAGPAESLWKLLVTMPTRVGASVTESEAIHLSMWLPPTVRAKACTVLLAGRAIPQEALRYEILENALWTSDNLRAPIRIQHSDHLPDKGILLPHWLYHG